MKTKKFFQIILLLLFSININAQIPPYVPTNGLVGWWPFTGNANDFSGNGNNGTNNGATLTTDRFANANSSYIFNNNYVITTFSGIGQNGGRAFSVWANGTSGALVAYGGQNDLPCPPDGDAFQIIQTGNLIEINVDCSSWVYLIPNYSANTWYHYVFSIPNNVNNLSGVQVYCNNTLLNVNTTQGNGAFSTILDLPVNFGRCHRGNIYYNGKIDDIGAWNRALSSCEVTQLYNSALSNGPISAILSKSVICAGQNATLSACGANSYTWSNSSNLNSIVVSPSITTTYSVSGTTSAGITSTSINLIVNPSPILSIIGNTAICKGETTTLKASGGNTYTWLSGNADSIFFPFPLGLTNSVTIGSQTPNIYNYTVTATGTNSCISAQAVQLLVSACTGIKDLEPEQQLSISPNPNGGEFVITAETIMQIKITDHLGRHIKTIEVKPGKNAYQLNDLSIGVYLLNGVSDGKIYKGKMVIN